MKFFTELNEDVNFIKEDAGDGKRNYFIEGIIMQGDIKNRNGRIYPINILDKEAARYMREEIANKRSMGELGHPQGPQINLDRVSHIFTELKKDGSNYIGKARLTETPMGNIAKGLYESGAKLGISSRGMGTLTHDKKAGAMIVGEDFRLATAGDIVANPSAPDAWPEFVMEGSEWIFDALTGEYVAIQEKVEKQRFIIKERYSKLTDEDKLQLFEDFMNTLRNK